MNVSKYAEKQQSTVNAKTNRCLLPVTLLTSFAWTSEFLAKVDAWFWNIKKNFCHLQLTHVVNKGDGDSNRQQPKKRHTKYHVFVVSTALDDDLASRTSADTAMKKIGCRILGLDGLRLDSCKGLYVKDKHEDTTVRMVETVAIDHDSTKYFLQKTQFKIKSYEREIIGKTWPIYKDNNKSKIKPLHYIKLAHQLSFRNINLKLDHNTAGKWFIHSPTHLKENQLLNVKHSWFSWVNYEKRRSMV